MTSELEGGQLSGWGILFDVSVVEDDFDMEFKLFLGEMCDDLLELLVWNDKYSCRLLLLEELFGCTSYEGD